MGAKTSTGGCFVLPTLTARADIQSDLVRAMVARDAVASAHHVPLHLPHLVLSRAAGPRRRSSVTSPAPRDRREVDAARCGQRGRDSP